MQHFTKEMNAFATCDDSETLPPNEKYGANTLDERKSLPYYCLLTLISTLRITVSTILMNGEHI